MAEQKVVEFIEYEEFEGDVYAAFSFPMKFSDEEYTLSYTKGALRRKINKCKAAGESAEIYEKALANWPD